MKKEINLNEKIFVAGANGMVGSAVCRELINSGYGKKENNAKNSGPLMSLIY